MKERGYSGGIEAADLKRLKEAGADVGLLMQIRDAAAGRGKAEPQGPIQPEGMRGNAESAPLPEDNPYRNIFKDSSDAAPAQEGRDPGSATRENPFVNSLGMKFVPVPGTKVLFGVWETRVRDYNTFVNETKRVWDKPNFEQTPDDPAVNVSWEDAKAFCAWLSQKEGRQYRLPTDQEWDAAVGNAKYPWGEAWPPPQGAGNYGVSNDGFSKTSPVGSFAANAFGLFDMGGNAWEWCEDWYRASMHTAEAKREWPGLSDDGGGQRYRVLRGGSWAYDNPVTLRSSFREGFGSGNCSGNRGFRCVVATSSP